MHRLPQNILALCTALHHSHTHPCVTYSSYRPTTFECEINCVIEAYQRDFFSRGGSNKLNWTINLQIFSERRGSDLSWTLPLHDLRLLNDQQLQVACMEAVFPSYTLQSRKLDIVIASPCMQHERRASGDTGQLFMFHHLGP